MKRLLLGFMLASAIACKGEPPPPADASPFFEAPGDPTDKKKWTVSPQGVGPVQIGMTADAIRAALADSNLADAADGTCTYVRSRKLPRGTSLMLNNGRLVRIDVDSAGVMTDEGLQVGDSEVAVMVMYSGRVSVESDKFLGPPAHVITVSAPNDTSRALVFTTDGSAVKSYRAGRRGAVELVERCG